MKIDNLQNSRLERFIHTLSDIVNREDALRIYYRFDGYPDKILETLDECIYEEMIRRNYFKNK
jgi:hypothetical protein